MAVVAAAVIGAGAATVAASCGEDDSGRADRGFEHGRDQHRWHHRNQHRFGDRGHQRHSGPGAGCGHDPDHRLRPPPDRRLLVTATEALKADMDAGSVPKAKQAYAAARPYYERIEPLVALFPELDGKIDAREDDFPKKGEDPNWTGFHPIERALWKDGAIDAHTRALAAGLVRRLQDPREAHGGGEGHAGGCDPGHGRARGRGGGVQDHGRGGALLEARPAHVRGQPRGRARVLRGARPDRGRRRTPISRTRSTTPSRPPSPRWTSSARAPASWPTTSSPTLSSAR